MFYLMVFIFSLINSFIYLCISYNCEDTECYKDLARLRGLHYLTWEKRDKLVQEDEVGISEIHAIYSCIINFSAVRATKNYIPVIIYNHKQERTV